jgi:uncharacterized protein YvpB
VKTRRAPLGLRPWQWIILLVMTAANAALITIFVPLVSADLQTPSAAPLAALASAAPTSPTRPPAPAPTLAPSPTPLAPAGPAANAVTTIVLATPAGSSPAILALPSPDPALPAEAQITGVVGHKQLYPLSCESRSAADFAAFFGYRIDEGEFLGRLPLSDNPDVGFVGDVHGRWGQIPPGPYGVHAGPVAFVLRQYGLNAHAYKGLTWDHLRAQIAAGKPVIVWVTGHVEPGAPVEYTASDGRTIVVARYEHTVIVIGYTPEAVTLLDGSKTYTRPLSVFLDSWAVLGNMAVTRGFVRFAP